MSKKYNFLEKVFSIKNSDNKIYKIITVAGISLKLRRFKPFVTVIVPNYNHAQYLEQRLESIYNQTYKNFEVILLDDCSTDNSIEILKKYQNKYKNNTKLIENEKNSGGVFYQWKKGLELAKGDLIWIAESDDWCNYNFLEELVNAFSDKDVMISYCRTLYMKNGQVSRDINKYLKDLKYDFNKPFVEKAEKVVNNGFGYKNIIPNASSALFRNTGFKTIINNSDWYKLRLCGDWLFYLDLIKNGKISYNPNTINYFRRHDESTTKSVIKSIVFFKEHEFIADYVSKNFNVKPIIFTKFFNMLTKFVKDDCDVKTIEELKQVFDIEKFTCNL